MEILKHAHAFGKCHGCWAITRTHTVERRIKVLKDQQNLRTNKFVCQSTKIGVFFFFSFFFRSRRERLSYQHMHDAKTKFDHSVLYTSNLFVLFLANKYISRTYQCGL